MIGRRSFLARLFAAPIVALTLLKSPDLKPHTTGSFGEEPIIGRLKKGRYGVEITIGKSYKSRRQEGESEMGNLLQSDPALLSVIGPEYFDLRIGS